MEIKKQKIKDLKPAEYNPREMDEETFNSPRVSSQFIFCPFPFVIDSYAGCPQQRGMISSLDYEQSEIRRVSYGIKGEGDAVFIPVCKNCGRFVKADKSIWVNESGLKDQPNATCKKCGRVEMLFEGFF